MSIVQLGEVIRQARTVRAGGETYPILSMTMHNGLVPQQEKFKKSVASKDLSDYKVVVRGQLVVGFPIDEGVLSFQEFADKVIVSPAYGIWDVCQQDRVHRPYLEKYLRSPHALAYYRAKLRGSTARRRSLPMPVFKEMPVPLPVMDEQRRIADILDKADALRAKRREAIAHLEALALSIFHRMFGDPANPSTGVKRVPLADLGTITTGNTPPRSDPLNYGDALEWIKTDNINSPGVSVTEAAERLSEKGAVKARTVDAGSILMTCIAGSRRVLGNVALVDRRVAFNQQINAFTPKSGEALFWYYMLLSMKPAVQELSTGGMTGLVSKTSLSKLEVPVVDSSLQQDFAVVAAAVERLKEKHRGQLAELDSLFLSLQDRAFKGGL